MGSTPVAHASAVADGMVTSTTLDDMAHTYASRKGFDPAADVVIAETDGIMIGFVRGWWLQEVGETFLYLHRGFVAPKWRRIGVGRSLLQWVEEHLRTVAAQHDARAEKLFNVFVTEPEVARGALFEEMGYHKARYFFSMRHPSLMSAAHFPMPTGIELRPVLPSHHRAIWDADQEVFASHWGRARAVEGEFEAWSQSASFQPQLWQIGWDIAANCVAGQARPYIDDSFNRQTGRLLCYTENIAVREPWRRRGLAKALVAHSLQALRCAGMLESTLEVDRRSPTDATNLYQICGFQIQEKNVVYRKQLLT